MSLIFVHELGHFLMATICGWETDKICLYPYGGISKFSSFINVTLKEEFLVLMMGPLAQILIYQVLMSLLSSRWQEVLTEYHMFLLWFNLLPIYPLDGGKFWNLVLCKYFPFRKSFEIIVWISYLGIFFVCGYFFINHSFFFLGVLCLIALKLQKEVALFPFVFRKFLLERCMYHFSFPKKKIIINEFQMKKDTYHLFKEKGKYVEEEQYLKKQMLRSFQK